MSKVMRLPLRAWRPDEGEYGHQALVSAQNGVFYAPNKMALLGELATTIGTPGVLTGSISGAHVNVAHGVNTPPRSLYVSGKNGATQVLVVTDDLGSPLWTYADVSGPSAYAPNALIGWDFTGYGNHEIACCGDGTPVQIRTNGSGNFADMVTSTEKPRFHYVGTFKGQVVGARITATGQTKITANPDMYIWLSELDDPLTFDHPDDTPSTLSNFAPFLDDHGSITGLGMGKEFFLVFKPNAIYRCLLGGAFGIDRKLISINAGTEFHNSVVVVEDEVYFFSHSGPARVQFDRVELLASGKTWRAMTDDNWPTRISNPPKFGDLAANSPVTVWGAYDAATNNVVWQLVDTAGNPQWITYSRAAGEMSWATPPTALLATALVSDLVRLRSWIPLRDLIVIGLSGKTYIPDPEEVNGDQFFATAIVGWPWMQLGGGAKATVEAVRPVMALKADDNPPKITATLRYADVPNSAVASITKQVTSLGGMDRRGFIRFDERKAAFFQQVELQFDLADPSPRSLSQVAEIEAVDIEYHEGAGR